MAYTPLSPFQRPITHTHLRLVENSTAPCMPKPVNKWGLLRELSTAQAGFGISDRDLTVLQALLSFYPANMLGDAHDMVVFPSNKSICERLNGMPCSTMRRHLLRLVNAGLLLRRDSPNGKRYSRKHGEERVAFGLDLAPLHQRAAEIAQAADAHRQVQQQMRQLRETVSLMRRDCAALAAFGEAQQPGLALWDQMRDTAALTARALRRALSLDELEQHRVEFDVLLGRATAVIAPVETATVITNDIPDEQHNQSSNNKTPVLEPADVETQADEGQQFSNADTEQSAVTYGGRIPLHLVISSCPSLANFHPDEVRSWDQLYHAASCVRPAMGISTQVWEEAQRTMGPGPASVVVVAMLERFAEIRSPSGYLRCLATKAMAGAFSCGPMIMALVGRKKAA